jgi:hypothetical protein
MVDIGNRSKQQQVISALFLQDPTIKQIDNSNADLWCGW